jgi:hypothetical protein
MQPRILLWSQFRWCASKPLRDPIRALVQNDFAEYWIYNHILVSELIPVGQESRIWLGAVARLAVKHATHPSRVNYSPKMDSLLLKWRTMGLHHARGVSTSHTPWADQTPGGEWTSGKPARRWEACFGDDVIAAKKG